MNKARRWWINNLFLHNSRRQKAFGWLKLIAACVGGLLLLEVLVWQAASSSPLTAVQIPQADRLTAVPLVTDLDRPVAAVGAGLADGRLFILEKAGRIRIWQPDGGLFAQPFLDIEAEVNSMGLEQGMLGLAFSPNYASDGSFYVNYTNLDGDTVVSRFSVDPANPNQAQPESEETILFIDQPGAEHNGGTLLFGPNDGYLYISVGDGMFGVPSGDPDNHAQNTADLLGTLLRIDVNPQTTPAPDCDPAGSYSIPADNPLVDGPGGACDEIWVYGLRNPWTFTLDPASNDLYIGDVGQFAYEEIDYVPGGSGGANFGWRCYEGYEPYNLDGCADPTGYTFPIYAYGHPYGCTAVSGRVYHGQWMPDLQGVYLFTDLCDGQIRSLRPNGQGGWQAEILLTTGERPVNFGVDEAGELLLVAYDSGIVYRLDPAPNTRNYLPLVFKAE